MDLTPLAVIFSLFFQFLSVKCSESEGSLCDLKDGSEGVCTRLSNCSAALKDIKNFKLPKFCSFNLWKPIVCCLDCRELDMENINNFSWMVPGYGKMNDKCLEEMYTSYPCNQHYDLEHLDDNITCYSPPYLMALGAAAGGYNAERNEYPHMQNVHSQQHECLDDLYISYPCNKNYDLKVLDDSITCYSPPSRFTATPVIAGGYVAERNEYPHMALIGYGADVENADWMCGGSVISDRYILTAAHCISSPALGEIRYAALGILKRTDDIGDWQIYDVTKIIGYPEYSPPSKYHDIALLRTRAKIRYNEQVLPACLYREQNLPRIAQATGWGAMGHRKPLADILQVVPIAKYTDEECYQAYPLHRHLKEGYNATTQACYGDEDKINDTCEGDSGGPLQVLTRGRRRSKCIYTIIGVTSYGRACGYIGSSGMYTRVAHYVPWIESITSPLH